MDIDYKEPSVDLNKIKHMLLWDFKLKEEKFADRERGFAFVIDVYKRNLELALYKISPMLSSTKKLLKQPPREMLERAVEEQGGNLDANDLYDANDEIKNWVKQNLM